MRSAAARLTGCWSGPSAASDGRWPNWSGSWRCVGWQACRYGWTNRRSIPEQSNALFMMSEAMALHLRQSRRDRILRGQAAARALSIRCGRPPIPIVKVERAKKLLATGKGVREVARMAGISVASASRLKNSVGPTTAGM